MKYGLLVGQPEVSSLPKFVPAFSIILLGLLTDAIILAIWKKEDFEMVELIEPPNEVDLRSYRVSVDEGQRRENPSKVCEQDFKAASTSGKAIVPKYEPESTERSRTNNRDAEIQYIVLKMILNTDGRLIKYLVLITLIGIMLSPINFIALSLTEVCDKRGCEFSHLEGLVLASQGFGESVSFLISPWVLPRFSRTSLFALCIFTLSARYFFYANFYYTADVSSSSCNSELKTQQLR